MLLAEVLMQDVGCRDRFIFKPKISINKRIEAYSASWSGDSTICRQRKVYVKNWTRTIKGAIHYLNK